MKKALFNALLMSLLLTFSASFNDALAKTDEVRALQTGVVVGEPRAHSNLCNVNPSICTPSKAVSWERTPEKLRQMLDAIKTVKNTLYQRPDGIIDVWQLKAFGGGDCDERAVFVRNYLNEKYGWPWSTLRLAIVRMPDIAGVMVGHLIVIAKFDGNDDVFIDPNYLGPLYEWWNPIYGYELIMIQTVEDPRKWRALQDWDKRKKMYLPTLIARSSTTAMLRN